MRKGFMAWAKNNKPNKLNRPRPKAAAKNKPRRRAGLALAAKPVTPATSATNAVSQNRRMKLVGLALAAKSTRANSAVLAVAQNLPAPPNTNVTNAVGNPKTRQTRPSSAPNAAMFLMTPIKNNNEGSSLLWLFLTRNFVIFAATELNF